MAKPVSEACEAPKIHEMHLCKLRQKGLLEELGRRSDRPTVVCAKCGAQANSERDLCKPRPL